MRLKRLVELLDAIQSEQHLTAGQLATRLKVSRRTVFRDIRDLVKVGVPILYDRTTTGFRLNRGVQRGTLTPTDMAALARLLSDEHVAAQHQRAVEALRKIVGKRTLDDLAGHPAGQDDG